MRSKFVLVIESPLMPNPGFAELASDEQIQRTAQALEANNIHVLVAADGAEARRMFFELIPPGAEVFLGASVTLQKLGIIDVLRTCVYNKVTIKT